MKINVYIKLILLLIFTQSNLVNANTVLSLDRALIKSLQEKNYKAAENCLKRGANPEATFGSQLSDNAVCTAIDDRSSKYLELLINYGASTNANFRKVQNSLRRTPLACSIYLGNFDAFEYLLENGADPSVDLHEESIEKYRNATTALTVALSNSMYPMALRLVKLYELHPAELRRLVFDLENSPYSEDHPWNDSRNQLIAWTRKRVPTFNPKPASPSNGPKPDCILSFRDMEEGLKKGTICREKNTDK